MQVLGRTTRWCDRFLVGSTTLCAGFEVLLAIVFCSVASFDMMLSAMLLEAGAATLQKQHSGRHHSAHQEGLVVSHEFSTVNVFDLDAGRKCLQQKTSSIRCFKWLAVWRLHLWQLDVIACSYTEASDLQHCGYLNATVSKNNAI